MSLSPKKIGGRFTVVAKLVAKPGKEDEVAKCLNDVRLSAISDKEPQCYTYRVSQFERTFAIFEEYENTAALRHHMQQPDFQKWTKIMPDLIDGKAEVLCYKEHTSKL
ncbi:hypothetical protein SISNIDRAFT_537328 [Sistotremastrum niveocremeum HHB9708]|uniref:ABM domain-containing protein n=1 Tax=Sistotremastrum niveocremeum HHB9708 TaxID=1314777 RepID=A0A164Y170_9AGAM|nr:hypothetical protein SISNIDRAFT_537328 [Sistotremastrum niveocremeum HHB9708]